MTNEIDAQIFSIALPTIATLAADPLAALVSTAYVGRLGAVELAGVGIALSLYNAITKVLNMPLLAVVTSSIAEALGSTERSSKEHHTKDIDGTVQSNTGTRAGPVQSDDDRLGSTIASAFLLAIGMGILQAILLSSADSLGLLRAWGVDSESSPLYSSAIRYLHVRALSAPITVVLLAAQGVFRGLGDTKYPLYATIVSNTINIILEPVFIFGFGWGVGGAASAVAMSQVVPAMGLVLAASKKANINPLDNFIRSRNSPSRLSREITIGMKVWGYIQPIGSLILRSIFVTIVYSAATKYAATTDPSHAAAHQIAFQLWLASSLLADSLAVAAQSLIARNNALGSEAAQQATDLVIQRVTTLSVALGCTLAAGLSFASFIMPLPSLFSSDEGVVRSLNVLLPVLVFTQPLNALAFTMDGILYGFKNGFSYAAKAMAMSFALPVLLMAVGHEYVLQSDMYSNDTMLYIVWGGLSLLMLMRFLTIYIPLKLKREPFDQYC